MLYSGVKATAGLAIQWEKTTPLGCLALSPTAERCHHAERMDMQTRLDRIYRRFLASHYTKHAFDAKRTYVDISGSSYITTPCYYCGIPATSEDHVLPLIVYRELLAMNEPPEKKRLLVVPSCHECNVLLTDNIFPSLQARKKYLKRRLRSRYQHIIHIPRWEEWEMRELGENLQSYVRQGHDARTLLYDRLAW